MKTRFILLLILISIIALLSEADKRFALAADEQKRVRFQITTIAENAKNGERKILARTTVEGLPGTDFNINLQTENYKMQARFLSDLTAESQLKLRAALNTRRFYGYSPANLPLYEEDAQKQTLQIKFGETVVLLPFGRNAGAAETLKIEITPALLFVSENNEDSQKLKINFDKQIPGGEIAIEASKVPHRFQTEAVLLADGKPFARGAADCLLEEEKEIILQPIAGADSGSQQFAAKVTINKFTRNRAADLVGINFDFYRAANEESKEQNQTIISNGAGVGVLGRDLIYPLKDTNLPIGKNYELKFVIRFAENERGD